MDFWDEWFRKFGKRSGFFIDIDRMIDEMEEEMAKAFHKMEEDMPREMSRETKLPDGSIRREYGPFVYGYSVKIGPDGKPIIREFGNMKPGSGQGEPPLNLQDRREPLVDVIEDADTVKVLAELPGVEKADIRLSATSKMLTLNVEGAERRYYKELEFPVDVDESTARSKYHNGVLEVVLRKKTHVGKGTQLAIE